MAQQPTRITKLTATVEAGVYAANDAFGERLDFTGALLESQGKGVLMSIILTAKNTSTPAIDVIFFDDVFQASADNDPSSFTESDLDNKGIGYVSLLAASWSVFANNAVATISGVALPIEVQNAPGTLYAQMVTRSGVTPGATDAYTIKLGFLKD